LEVVFDVDGQDVGKQGGGRGELRVASCEEREWVKGGGDHEKHESHEKKSCSLSCVWCVSWSIQTRPAAYGGTRNSKTSGPLPAANAADLPRCAGEVERDVSTAFRETFWLPSPSDAGERERVSIRGRGAGGEGVKTGSAAQR